MPPHRRSGAGAGVNDGAVVLQCYPSRSNPDTLHEVRRGQDGVIYCTCWAWRRSAEPRTCTHLEQFFMANEDMRPLTSQNYIERTSPEWTASRTMRNVMGGMQDDHDEEREARAEAMELEHERREWEANEVRMDSPARPIVSTRTTGKGIYAVKYNGSEVARLEGTSVEEVRAKLVSTSGENGRIEVVKVNARRT